jgi:hypothetical protein
MISPKETFIPKRLLLLHPGNTRECNVLLQVLIKDFNILLAWK